MREYKRDKLGRIMFESQGQDSGDYLLYSAEGFFKGRVEQGSLSPKTSYLYDANGNRLSGEDGQGKFTAEYDVQDRLVRMRNRKYSYDENGDLIRSENTSNPGNYSDYTYDVFGNLKSVTTPDKTVTYQIDGQNRRVSKSVNGVLKEQYIYQSQLQISAVMDGNGNLVKRFTYALDNNAPDHMKFNDDDYLLIKDARGSIHLVVNASSGNVLQELRYDDWGKVTYDSNPGFQPFGFAGGLYDLDTGFVRFGIRDYDAETGRWTIKDPIRFEGSAFNLYGYASQDPINFIDPTGRVECDAADYQRNEAEKFRDNISTIKDALCDESNAEDFDVLKNLYDEYANKLKEAEFRQRKANTKCQHDNEDYSAFTN